MSSSAGGFKFIYKFIMSLSMENKENKSELIIYQTEDEQTKLQVEIENETVWLT